MSDPAAVGSQFTTYYYSVFDGDRSQLAPLYRAHSMMTWEGEQILGAETILKKLTELPFQTVKHDITKIDVQPASVSGGNLLVSVIGMLRVDDGEHPLQFSQVFQLIPENQTYYVLNDIFRLSLG